MKYENSKEYRSASPTLMKQFIGLRNKPYEGRSFVIDERDARMIVANLPKKDYAEFKREYQNKNFASFRLLQDYEYRRKGNVKTAQEIFRIRYPDGSKNFMTPRVIRYGKISKNVAYELSSGSGFDYNSTIYGVTIVMYNPINKTAESLHDYSKSFGSRERAESYIKRLREEISR